MRDRPVPLPCLPSRSSHMTAAIPLHRGSGIIPAELMDKFHGLFRSVSLLKSLLILGMGIQVVVGINGIPFHIPHAEFLTLIDEGCPSQRQ